MFRQNGKYFAKEFSAVNGGPLTNGSKTTGRVIEHAKTK
jgi:hypothetical protein